MNNTFKMNDKDSLGYALEQARSECDEGIIYLNTTPFSCENDITRFLTLSKSSILKTSTGYIAYNNKSEQRKEFCLVTSDIIDDIEIKENFGVDYMESRKSVIPSLKYTKEWEKIIKTYNKIMTENLKNLAHKIPKILHFIYVVNPPPKEMAERMEKWRAYHPDWEIKFWGDKEADSLKMFNRSQYDKTLNPGEKSDILRYEILYQEGGVYVDHDFDCLGNINIFNKISDFWCGCALDEYFTAFNGLIGCVPHNPVVKTLIDEIGKLTKPSFNAHEVQTNTGPYLLSRVLKKFISLDWSNILILPPTYFYPTSVRGEGKIQPESYANHLWGRSWVRQSYGTSGTPNKKASRNVTTVSRSNNKIKNINYKY